MSSRIRFYQTLNPRGEVFTVWGHLSQAIRSALHNGPTGWSVRDSLTGRVVWAFKVKEPPAVERKSPRYPWSRHHDRPAMA